MDLLRQLFYALIDNPIAIIIVGGYLLSMFGGVFKKAAKQAEMQRRKQQQRDASTQLPSARREEPREAQVESRTLQPTARVDRSSRRAARQSGGGDRSPDQIAAEIRRIMGMEEPRQADTPEPEVEEVLQDSPIVADEVGSGRSPGQLAGGGGSWSSFSGSMVGGTSLGGGVSGLSPGTGLVGSHPIGSGSVGVGSMGTLGGRLSGKRAGRGRKRDSGRMVDLSHPAKAIVMMEVLGPPKALRSSDELI